MTEKEQKVEGDLIVAYFSANVLCIGKNDVFSGKQ
jgi:hypothetical protein